MSSESDCRSAARVISLFAPAEFPVSLAKIPCFVAQGILLQAIDFAGSLGTKNRRESRIFPEFPVNFPVRREFARGDRFDCDCLRRHDLSNGYRCLFCLRGRANSCAHSGTLRRTACAALHAETNSCGVCRNRHARVSIAQFGGTAVSRRQTNSRRENETHNQRPLEKISTRGRTDRH
jgi:hypothetical protein